eukprot:8591052-Pyramimonas_sp.AAC.2
MKVATTASWSSPYAPYRPHVPHVRSSTRPSRYATIGFRPSDRPWAPWVARGMGEHSRWVIILGVNENSMGRERENAGRTLASSQEKGNMQGRASDKRQTALTGTEISAEVSESVQSRQHKQSALISVPARAVRRLSVVGRPRGRYGVLRGGSGPPGPLRGHIGGLDLPRPHPPITLGG